MKQTYTLYMHRHYTFTGRQLKNIAGVVVMFDKGVATGVDEATAKAARRYRYIDSERTHLDPKFSEPHVATHGTTSVQLPLEDDVKPVSDQTTEEEAAGPQPVAPEEEETTEDEPLVEETEEEETVEEKEEPEDEPEEEPEEEVEEEPKEEAPESEEEATEPDVQALYKELKTWTAVADHLGITVAALRKLREEQGLL